MITIGSDHQRFDTRTGELIHRCLRTCRYHEDLIETDYPIGTDGNIPIVAFAHRPHDARSSCMAFLPPSHHQRANVAELHQLGVPIAFFAGTTSWEMWSLRADGPRHERTMASKDVERFFDNNKEDLRPGSVFRAKTWARSEAVRQLDFVDTGLLPIVERQAGQRLRQLFEDMLAHTMDALDATPSALAEADAHWMMKANFWLLAGKLLRDKQVPKFMRLDLNDVQNVFDRVAEHYDARRIRANGRLTALRGAAGVAAQFSSLRSISTETLGALYEEALLSERTRKLLSVHRTPTYLVDFVLAKLSRWILEDIGIQKCRVFEPACGHAPFLVGAVRVLSDLLPDYISSDRNARCQFLRGHIGGCDRDAFSLEIARLSLTLADIPNPNGWKLDSVRDMYADDYLAKKISASSVIIANPPFENASISMAARTGGDLRYARSGQAGELLRRIVNHSSANTLFAIVLPQTILDGSSFRDLRRNLLTNVEVREVVTFPDNVFKFAKPETAIVFGKKQQGAQSSLGEFKFRCVRKAQMEAFRTKNELPSASTVSRSKILADPRCQLLVPPLRAVWEFQHNLPQFKEVAFITIGFYFYPEDDPAYPEGEVQVSLKQKPGFYEGFRLAEGTPQTHLLPRLEWLNQKAEIIEWPCGGTKRGEPRVVMNHVRTGAGAWRHKAFIDRVGRPATDAFILLSPIKPFWSLETLWAIANGPMANAYTLTNSAAKQIGVRLLQRMRVPSLVDIPSKLLSAVESYFTAAREFTKKHPDGSPPERLRKDHNRTNFPETPELPLQHSASSESKELSDARDRLRALHWRVDAEVLKLYALPAQAERELLDFFEGVPRVGVPFVQRTYIPAGFNEVQTLDDFLRITDEWEQTDERRCQLIETRARTGTRSSVEETEFQELQRLFSLRRKYVRWLKTGNANDPLFDDKKLRQLIEEDRR